MTSITTKLDSYNIKSVEAMIFYYLLQLEKPTDHQTELDVPPAQRET